MSRFLKFVAQYIIIFGVLVSIAFSPLFLLFFSSYPVFAADSQSTSQDLEKYGIKLYRGTYDRSVDPTLRKVLFAYESGEIEGSSEGFRRIADPESLSSLGLNLNDILDVGELTYASLRQHGVYSSTGKTAIRLGELLEQYKSNYQTQQDKKRINEESARNNQIVDQLRSGGLSNIEQSDIDRVASGVPIQQVISEKKVLQNPNNKLPTETFEQWQQRTGVAPPGQQTEVTPTLSVTPSEQSIPVFAGNLIFRIINTSGGIMNWTASVTSGSSWFSIDDVTAGVNNGIMSEKTIMVRFLQNNDQSSRTAEITVVAPGTTGSPKVITITQAGSAIISPVPNTQEQKAAEQERARRLEAERQKQEDQRRIDEQLRAKAAADEALKRAKNDEEQRIAEEARKKAEDARIAAEQEAQKHQQEEILRKAQEEQKQAEEQRKAQATTEETKQKEQQPTEPRSDSQTQFTLKSNSIPIPSPTPITLEPQKQQTRDIQMPIPTTSPKNVVQQTLYTPPATQDSVLNKIGTSITGAGYYTAQSLTKEIGFTVRHPIIAPQIGTSKQGRENISTYASNFSVNSGLKENQEQEGSQTNAYRHFVWQSIITTKFGESIAHQVGNAHEDNPYADLSIRNFNGKSYKANLHEADQIIDLLNNDLVRRFALENPNDSAKTLAMQGLDYFYNKGLYIGVQDGKNVKIVLYRLTKDEYINALSKIKKVGEDGLLPHR